MAYSEAAQAYIDGLTDGSIPACQWVKLAVCRATTDLSRQGQPDFPFTFDSAKAQRVCQFIEQLPHIQGPLGGQRIRLEPWQHFALETIFGWVRPGGFRRFRRAFLEMGRGNGKTLLAAAVAAYCTFAEKEAGADSICTATVLTQARLVLDTARAMVRKSKKLAEKLGLKVLAHQILQPATDSRLRGMPGKGATLEGVSLHLGIIDELHAHTGRQVYDVLSTATAKRDQSLLLMITTAGKDESGICFELQDFVERILTGEARDDSFFGLIYTTDADDVWDSEAAWRKANPNFGVSIEPSVIAEEARRAKQIPSQRTQFRQKYLCEWAGSGNQQFLNPVHVRACLDSTLKEEDFAGGHCVLGLDLASRLDLTSAVRVHSRTTNDEMHYYVFCRNWLPKATARDAKTAAYKGWLATGHLITTPGMVTDLDFVEAQIAEDCQKYNVRDVSFDPLQSNQLVSHLQKRIRSDLFVEIGQFAKNMTEGMHALSEAVAGGRLHTNSPVLLWALNNLQSKEVGMHMIYPTRPKDRTLKIDPAVALVMAMRSISRVPLEESMYGDWDGNIRFLEDIPLTPALPPSAPAKPKEDGKKLTQEEILRAMYALPQGSWLVILDANGKEHRLHRTVAAIKVVMGEYQLVRAEP